MPMRRQSSRGPRHRWVRPATAVTTVLALALALILGLSVAAEVYLGLGLFAASGDGPSAAPPTMTTTLPKSPTPQPPPRIELTCAQSGRIYSCQAGWDETDPSTVRWTVDGRPVTRWNDETYVRGACPVGARRKVTVVVSNPSGSDRHSTSIPCRPYA